MPQLDDGRITLPPAVRKKITEGQQAFDAQFQPPSATPPEAVSSPADPPQDQPPTEETPVTDPNEQPPIGDPPSEEPSQEGSLADFQARLLHAEHRFNSLQGRYRTDMERQARQLADVQRQLNESMAQVTALTAKLSANNPENEPQNKNLTRRRNFARITDAERAEFGEGFFDMLARANEDIIEQEVAARLGQLPDAVKNLATRLDQSDHRYSLTKQERREQWLDGNVAGWREQDADPGFMQWLQQEDAFSGVPRIGILSHAMERDDYTRIKLIFEGYAQELGAIAPTVPPRPSATSNGQARLKAQAMPNGGGGRVDAIVPNAPEAPPTPEEIAAYYARKTRNRKSLTEAEITHMEGRIARGLAAGTIRGVPRV